MNLIFPITRQSAGGMSVAVQMAMSSSADLFSGAIIESGIGEGYPSLYVGISHL